MVDIPRGALVIDLDGDLTLIDSDYARLEHPGIGGVILFARNYSDRDQLQELTATIHKIRKPRLFVCVDQEGGRVQRFRDGFTRLPAAATFGELFDTDPDAAQATARHFGRVMAAELRACGIDFSFAPVLDVGRVASDVIGDRAFHHDPRAVSTLAGAFIAGMHEADMPAIGKHFPGHGGVSADSHQCLPCDERMLDEIRDCDLLPYRELMTALAGVMTAHVHYEKINEQVPAYSSYWLQEVLRGELGFNGAVFSDDLSMQGAVTDQPAAARAERALRAGCDFLIVCNDRPAVDAILAGTSGIASASRFREQFHV